MYSLSICMPCVSVTCCYCYSLCCWLCTCVISVGFLFCIMCSCFPSHAFLLPLLIFWQRVSLSLFQELNRYKVFVYNLVCILGGSFYFFDFLFFLCLLHILRVRLFLMSLLSTMKTGEDLPSAKTANLILFGSLIVSAIYIK